MSTADSRAASLRWTAVVRRFALVAFAAAAVYHTVAVALPDAGIPGSRPRHVVFAAVTLAGAIGLVARSRALLPALVILTVQQGFSHGGRAWRWWAEEGRVDGVSIAVLSFFALVLVALAVESADNRRSRRPGAVSSSRSGA